MKKKDIIKLITICLIFLILFVLILFIQLKDRIQIPFESDTLSRLAELSEFKKVGKRENITKIEVLSPSTKNEFTTKEDIDKIVAFLETVEGYRISTSYVNLTSNVYDILIYYGGNEPMQIVLSPINFYITNDKAYKNKYYKNAKNYYVLIRNLVEEINKD